MNQEKETMQMCNSAGEYLAPSVMVVEVKARRMMCLSSVTTGFPSMEDEDGVW